MKRKRATTDRALALFRGKARAELVGHARTMRMSVDAFVRLCINEAGWQLAMK